MATTTPDYYNVSINYGDNVKEVVNCLEDENYFAWDFTLSSLANARKLEEIGEYAFSTLVGAAVLEDPLVLPRSLKKIGDRAFMRMNITSVDIPDGVQSLGIGAFAWCNVLTNVKIPSLILEVPSHCFNGTKVNPGEVMHDNIRRIRDYSFANLAHSSLRTITVVMPAKLEQIDAGAFGGAGKFVYDFTRCEQVPTLAEVAALGNIQEIVVSPSMYGAFGTAPVWSTIANKLVVGETRVNKIEDTSHAGGEDN